MRPFPLLMKMLEKPLYKTWRLYVYTALVKKLMVVVVNTCRNEFVENCDCAKIVVVVKTIGNGEQGCLAMRITFVIITDQSGVKMYYEMSKARGLSIKN